VITNHNKFDEGKYKARLDAAIEVKPVLGERAAHNTFTLKSSIINLPNYMGNQ
jgi:hypothetical protein